MSNGPSQVPARRLRGCWCVLTFSGKNRLCLLSSSAHSNREEQTELNSVSQVCGGWARDGGRKRDASPEVHMSHSDHSVLYNPPTHHLLHGIEGVLVQGLHSAYVFLA